MTRSNPGRSMRPEGAARRSARRILSESVSVNSNVAVDLLTRLRKLEFCTVHMQASTAARNFRRRFIIRMDFCVSDME